jgi:hypothetical protein
MALTGLCACREVHHKQVLANFLIRVKSGCILLICFATKCKKTYRLDVGSNLSWMRRKISFGWMSGREKQWLTIGRPGRLSREGRKRAGRQTKDCEVPLQAEPKWMASSSFFKTW